MTEPTTDHDLETEPDAAAPARRGGAIRRAAAVLLGIALISTGAIALVVALGSVDLSAARSPSPSPSAAGAGPTHPPDDGVAAARALTTVMGGVEATFHVEANGTIGLDRSIGSLAFAVDVARPDAAGRSSGTLIGTAREFVQTAKGAWTRSGTAPWTPQPAFKSNRGWDPFAGLTRASVAVDFVRWEATATGRQAIIEIEDLVALDPLDYLDVDLSNVSVDASSFTVTAAEDGTPRAATWSIDESGLDADGIKHLVHGKFEYEFTKVGEPVTITAPQ